MSSFYQEAEVLLNRKSNGPCLIHSDIFKAKAMVGKISKPAELLHQHVECLINLYPDQQVFIPSFNYDFTRTGIYNVGHDPSQVGSLTEHIRTNQASWRIGPPIFNFCGLQNTSPPELSEFGEVDPFDDDSLFAHLYKENGQVLLYGADFSSFTAIHYIERKTNGPLYRYDKFFPGIIKTKGKANAPVNLKYHVRPQTQHLDYAWQKLFNDAISHGFIDRISHSGSQLALIDYRALCDYWQERLQEDPLFLIDDESHLWIKKFLDKHGRRVTLQDFET